MKGIWSRLRALARAIWLRRTYAERQAAEQIKRILEGKDKR